MSTKRIDQLKVSVHETVAEVIVEEIGEETPTPHIKISAGLTPTFDQEPAWGDHEESTTKVHRRFKGSDKLSKSRKLCGCCLVGPSEKSLMPKIATVAMILVLSMNCFALWYLWP